MTFFVEGITWVARCGIGLVCDQVVDFIHHIVLDLISETQKENGWVTCKNLFRPFRLQIQPSLTGLFSTISDRLGPLAVLVVQMICYGTNFGLVRVLGRPGVLKDPFYYHTDLLLPSPSMSLSRNIETLGWRKPSAETKKTRQATIEEEYNHYYAWFFTCRLSELFVRLRHTNASSEPSEEACMVIAKKSDVKPKTFVELVKAVYKSVKHDTSPLMIIKSSVVLW